MREIESSVFPKVDVRVAMLLRVIDDQKEKHLVIGDILKNQRLFMRKKNPFATAYPNPNFFPGTQVQSEDIQADERDQLNWEVIICNSASRLLNELNVLGERFPLVYLDNLKHGGTISHLVACVFKQFPVIITGIHRSSEFEPLQDWIEIFTDDIQTRTPAERDFFQVILDNSQQLKSL